MKFFNESTVNDLFFITEHKFISSLYTNNAVFTETSIYDIGKAISEYIQKVINDLKAFAKHIKSDIISLARRRETFTKLKQLKKELQEQKDLGKTQVLIFDYEKYAKEYNKMVMSSVKELSSLLRKRYTSKGDIENEMYKFERKMEERENDLDIILNTKVTKNINDAITYVEENLNGTISIEKTLLDAIHEMDRLKTESERIFKNIRLSEENEIRSTYTGCIRRSVTRLSRSFTESFKKFVVRSICLFA